jgi:hypothetical protein
MQLTFVRSLVSLFSSSIEINHQTKDLVKKSQIGAGAAIKIDHAVYRMTSRACEETDL